MTQEQTGHEREGLMRLVFAARSARVLDVEVLKALEATPRAQFVEPMFANRAYENTALPIPCGQTMTQPSLVAQMLQALEISPRNRVLEVGCGSGYQAALLAVMCRWVYCLERHPALMKQALQRFEAQKLSNIAAKVADGAWGWPEQAPFDRIIVTAAVEDAPAPLLEQLREGGVLVAPIGGLGESEQNLLKVTKTPRGPYYEELGPVRFAPLLEGVAEE